MHIKYIGQKAKKQDNVASTGLVWEPGEVHEVKDPGKAAALLKFPGVWELVEATESEAESDERETLRKQLTELGIAFHPRHGVDRLRELLASAVKPEADTQA